MVGEVSGEKKKVVLREGLAPHEGGHSSGDLVDYHSQLSAGYFLPVKVPFQFN